MDAGQKIIFELIGNALNIRLFADNIHEGEIFRPETDTVEVSFPGLRN